MKRLHLPAQLLLLPGGILQHYVSGKMIYDCFHALLRRLSLLSTRRWGEKHAGRQHGGNAWGENTATHPSLNLRGILSGTVSIIGTNLPGSPTTFRLGDDISAAQLRHLRHAAGARRDGAAPKLFIRTRAGIPILAPHFGRRSA
jgi:hypothetical protein